MNHPLSTELSALAGRFADRPVRLAELMSVLQLRGYNALLLFLALPFVTPIPLPGFSTPFGVLIALLGLRMSLGWKPWLPDTFAQRELPSRGLPGVLRTASRLMRRLEAVLKPRWFY